MKSSRMYVRTVIRNSENASTIVREYMVRTILFHGEQRSIDREASEGTKKAEIYNLSTGTIGRSFNARRQEYPLGFPCMQPYMRPQVGHSATPPLSI